MTLSNTETINWKLVSTSTQANIDPETFKRRMLLDQDPRWLMTFVVDDDKHLASVIVEQSGIILASSCFFVLLLLWNLLLKRSSVSLIILFVFWVLA